MSSEVSVKGVSVRGEYVLGVGVQGVRTCPRGLCPRAINDTGIRSPIWVSCKSFSDNAFLS